VEYRLCKLPEKYHGVVIISACVMPNHLHFIVGIPVGEKYSVPDIVQWFKTMTTNEYIQGVKQDGWPPFDKRFWQRNYYERIIRNDEELHALSKYIEINPENWEEDEHHIP
jgi:putative transposase